MHIESLSILNYKNLKEVKVDFSAKLNCFIGKNGSGKTNLLDAIYYLSFCKSFFNAVDQMNINHDEKFFMLSGDYKRIDSMENISCGFKSGHKKQFKRNSKLYRKLAEHIGLLPLVMVSPSDVNLILGGSDERRKFMDGVISQYNHDYLDNLLRYNRALSQRNNLLKQFASGNYFDKELLSIWDHQLIECGTSIHDQRKLFVEKLVPVFSDYYSFITANKETIRLEYRSGLHKNEFSELIEESLSRDRIMQHTTQGIHKDDLVFYLGDYPMKRIGSQGQKKTYLVALKLAQFDFVKKISGIKPILLLDDIFDKLDQQRVEQIVKVVAGEEFGQIFLTDTNREHLDDIVQKMETEFRIFNVVEGQTEILK